MTTTAPMTDQAQAAAIRVATHRLGVEVGARRVDRWRDDADPIDGTDADYRARLATAAEDVDWSASDDSSHSPADLRSALLDVMAAAGAWIDAIDNRPDDA